MLGMAFRPILPLVGLYTAIVIGAFLTRPAVGVTGLIMVLPFEAHFSESLPFSPFYVLAPGMLLGYWAHANRMGNPIPFSKDLLIFGGAIVVVAFFSMAGSSFPPQYRTLMSLCLMISMVLVVSSVIKSDRHAFLLIGHGLIVAGVIAAIGGFMYIGGSDRQAVLGLDAGGRLAIGGNVRVVANSLGLPWLLLLMSVLLTRKDRTLRDGAPRIFPFEGKFLLQIILIVAFSITLIATGSRGSWIAVIGSLCCFLIAVLIAAQGGEKRFQLAYWAVPVIGFTLYVAAVVGYAYVDTELLAGRMGERLHQLINEPLSDPRIVIWSTAFAGMSGFDWIIGTGIGTFRGVVARAGLDFYAHSVFLDLLVTTGIIGSGILMILLWRIIKHLFRTHNLIGIGLFFLMVLSYSTHGSVSGKGFWISLGLVHGVSTLPSLGIVPRRTVPAHINARPRGGVGRVGIRAPRGVSPALPQHMGRL